MGFGFAEGWNASLCPPGVLHGSVDLREEKKAGLLDLPCFRYSICVSPRIPEWILQAKTHTNFALPFFLVISLFFCFCRQKKGRRVCLTWQLFYMKIPAWILGFANRKKEGRSARPALLQFSHMLIPDCGMASRIRRQHKKGKPVRPALLFAIPDLCMDLWARGQQKQGP